MPPTAQHQVDAGPASQGLALYHFQSCPFCVRVRRQIAALGLDIEMRDILEDRRHRQALVEGGGKSQVPCLLITDQHGRQQWLYESAEINRYLSGRFG